MGAREKATKAVTAAGGGGRERPATTGGVAEPTPNADAPA